MTLTRRRVNYSFTLADVLYRASSSLLHPIRQEET